MNGRSKTGRMRILVCAHDYWPNTSPQSMRITHLVNELESLGHEIVVLSRTAAAIGVEDVSSSKCVIRTHPGVFEASLDWLVTRRRAAAVGRRSGDDAAFPSSTAPVGGGLNWKGRLVQFLRNYHSRLWFPDGRSAWCSSALKEGRSRLSGWKPDVIIASHEPAASLLVGLRLAGEFNIPLVAELGDPILAPYTPERWKSRSFELEALVCREAAAVVVTSEATADLLVDRHGQRRKLHVIPQGFSLIPQPEVHSIVDSDLLRIVYTGRFYPFRDPAPFVQAVLSTPGCALVVAGPGLPPGLSDLFSANPEVLQYVGQLDQRRAIELQHGADLLLSIGNAGMTQIPGKLLEYLGAGRPVLHVQPDGSDAAAELVHTERCGFIVPNQADEIAATLRELVRRKADGALEAGLRLGADTFEAYRWDRLARRLEQACLDVAQGAGHRPAPWA